MIAVSADQRGVAKVLRLTGDKYFTYRGVEVHIVKFDRLHDLTYCVEVHHPDYGTIISLLHHESPVAVAREAIQAARDLLQR